MITVRIAALFSLMLIMGGCWAPSESEQKPLVINVLDKGLYNDCHIPGSVQVDFDKVDRYVAHIPKSNPIIVYCSNYACMTSHFVARRLIEKEYTHVQVYAGGITEWFLKGYPVEGPAQAAYLHKEVAPSEEESEGISKISIRELAELLKIV